MNNKEENSSNFCLDFVQEFGLCSRRRRRADGGIGEGKWELRDLKLAGEAGMQYMDCHGL